MYVDVWMAGKGTQHLCSLAFTSELMVDDGLFHICNTENRVAVLRRGVGHVCKKNGGRWITIELLKSRGKSLSCVLFMHCLSATSSAGKKIATCTRRTQKIKVSHFSFQKIFKKYLNKLEPL
jgi:hypothetical protein